MLRKLRVVNKKQLREKLLIIKNHGQCKGGIYNYGYSSRDKI